MSVHLSLSADQGILSFDISRKLLCQQTYHLRKLRNSNELSVFQNCGVLFPTQIRSRHRFRQIKGVFLPTRKILIQISALLLLKHEQKWQRRTLEIFSRAQCMGLRSQVCTVHNQTKMCFQSGLRAVAHLNRLFCIFSQNAGSFKRMLSQQIVPDRSAKEQPLRSSEAMNVASTCCSTVRPHEIFACHEQL